MENLPDEVILLVLSFLEPRDIVSYQILSYRFVRLSRDNELWKRICFDRSRAEALRRRREWLADSHASNLTSLRDALELAPPPWLNGRSTDNPIRRRQRAFANWDPTFPGSKFNWYQEYVQRHGNIAFGWLEPLMDGQGDSAEVRETIGMGIMRNADGEADKVVGPLDDGGLCIWNVSSTSESRKGQLLARTPKGFLSGGNQASVSLTNEVGAIENISIDYHQDRAYVAVANSLAEIDLRTLGVIRRQTFPFPISALSESRSGTPLTVGTTMTLHLHDTRLATYGINPDALSRTELIGGAGSATRVPSSHVTLSQPGPLSILHSPANADDIWVAGRFTSLLNYDRRQWPRIRGTVFSGARLSSLTSVSQPYIPRGLDLLSQPAVPLSALAHVKSLPGATLVAAGEYKGKGSLEKYSLCATSPTDPLLHGMDTCYQNRQTASKSRLLSVAAHGARLVYSDGDGNLKWVERDASTPARSFNINDDVLDTPAPAPTGSLFASTTSARGGGHATGHAGSGDIVQKVVTTGADSTGDLLVWTGDGRVGLLEFGARSSLTYAGRSGDEDDQVQEEEAREREQQKIYGERMRRALEVQADETRFVRGLGMPFMM